MRLALVIGLPLLAYWLIHAWLTADFREPLSRFASEPFAAAEAASMASRAINSWLRPFGLLWLPIGLFAIAWAMQGFYSDSHVIGRARKITTKRLTLRRAVAADTPALHAILSDPDTLRYWDTHPHRSIAETETWFTGQIDEDDEESDTFIALRDGEVIGWLGSKRYPWVTYLFARSSWGQGYAGEALHAFTGYMSDRGWNALYAVTDARNAASLALLARTGFTEIERASLTHDATGETIEGVYLKREVTEAAS